MRPVLAARGTTDFHERYLLSIHGGLKLGMGLQWLVECGAIPPGPSATSTPPYDGQTWKPRV